MGRPVKSDVNGVKVFGTYTGDAGIRCEAFIGSNQVDVFIVKQKGSKRYLVQDTSAGTQSICRLVSGEPAAAGQMRLSGYLETGADASVIRIAKLQKRTAIDFNGVRYKWRLGNFADSTGDQIFLTPL
jgi:hypothetical protein